MSKSHIDERTLVPIGWVATGISAIVILVIKITFIFSSIDARLKRLEDKSGLPPYSASISIIESAKAGQR